MKWNDRLVCLCANEIVSPSLKQNARPFADEKWKTILDDSTDPIAKGTWSTQKEDPSWMSGMRRYGAAKLCAIMMM
jgi:hypothetical protein